MRVEINPQHKMWVLFVLAMVCVILAGYAGLFVGGVKACENTGYDGLNKNGWSCVNMTKEWWEDELFTPPGGLNWTR